MSNGRKVRNVLALKRAFETAVAKLRNDSPKADWTKFTRALEAYLCAKEGKDSK